MKKTTAEERASEMFFKILIRDLPDKARAYNRYLCSKYGACGEVTLTAYCHYAQAIEKLPCNNPEHQIDEEGIVYFNSLYSKESEG